LELTVFAFGIILSLVPARLFLRTHYLTRKWKGRRLGHGVDLRPFFQTELHNQLIDSFPVSIVLVFIFVPLYRAIEGAHIFQAMLTPPLSSLKLSLCSIPGLFTPEGVVREENLNTLHLMAVFYGFSVPFILLSIFSAICGWVSGQFRWNVVERFVHTIPNKWFYVFLAEPKPGVLKTIVMLEILSKVERPNGYHCIYRGRMSRFLLNENGEPEVLILENVERAEARPSISESLKNEHYERVSLPGQFFTIRYDEIQNINISHVDIIRIARGSPKKVENDKGKKDAGT